MHDNRKALGKPLSAIKPTERRPTRPSAHSPQLTPSQQILVSQFDPIARRGLRKSIRENKRFADIAAVFPGAAYALATTHRPYAKRKIAAQLVTQGAPLKHVAQALDLPMWLRRLPAHAFRGPLGPFPSSVSFGRRVANRIPTNHRANAFWLESLCFASKAAHEEFALWLATQHIRADVGEAERLFAVLAAYAWHSKAPRNEAQSLIVVPWRAEIAFDTALCAAKSWFNRLRLVMQLERGAISESWLEEGEANGFQFVPLLDRHQILEESKAMQNCTDQYADRLARDRCRLFSVQSRGTHVATLEVGPHPVEAGILTITQLKGRHNMPASLRVWQASHIWLASQPGLKRMPPKTVKNLPLNTSTWHKLLWDYRNQKDGAPWMPEQPSQTAFQRLDSALTDLARRSGVTSWLFT